ncbi:MAG: amidohydrolase family protein, partial [Alphaproteobacteria bacterium]|nr:amidohydrolase family protein [Alphaproteobacteria bacterium]
MRLVCWMIMAVLVLTGVPAMAQVTVIYAGSVIRDADSEPIGPATITISDGRILSIAQGHQTPTGEARVIDLADKTVLPGLIDLHVHLTGDPGGDFW